MDKRLVVTVLTLLRSFSLLRREREGGGGGDRDRRGGGGGQERESERELNGPGRNERSRWAVLMQSSTATRAFCPGRRGHGARETLTPPRGDHGDR